MIKNERQYRVTKAQLRAFQESLEQVGAMEAPTEIEPELLTATQAALSSQHEDLLAEVEEYEALQRGEISRFVAESLSEIPRILIKARIALGLNQRELAARLEVKEQQVQRWEATDYENASMDTLKQVIEALGVETREELFLPNERLTPQVFLRNLTYAGIPKEFLLRRLLPSSIAAAFKEGNAIQVGLREILCAASAVSRVFGAPISDLVSVQPPKLAFAGIAATRFKLPARTKAATLNAYSIYAHYLAALVESCADPAPLKSLSNDWHTIHAALSRPGEPMTFASTLRYLWDHNVVVVPLRDEGTFHGAVWKIRGRFVIIVKQRTSLESRWLFDLLHETGHTASGHVTDEVALIEDQPISPEVRGIEEEEANEWAEDALFDGDSSLLEDDCVQACGGRLQQLNRVIPTVAKRRNVNAGALANHMAFRLAAQGEQWWGAAHNLQADGPDPFATAREMLFQRVSLRRLNSLDRDLLMRALTED
jgi:transcriptional regulator with XRE-family HTH domain